jgi:hypothetical protein
MISVNNIKRACLAALNNQLNPNSDKDAALALEVVNTFQAPGFFVENNQLGFFTGKTVEEQSGAPAGLGVLHPLHLQLLHLHPGIVLTTAEGRSNAAVGCVCNSLPVSSAYHKPSQLPSHLC